MSRKLALVFNIHPGEGRLVGLFLLHYFLLGAAFNFTQTAAFTLFLVEFSAQSLPYVYIANAVVVTLITFVYLKLGQRLSFSRLLALNLSFLLVCIGLFRLGLALTGAAWLVFALPMLFQALVNLGNVEFWTLAGRLFDVRQGKRLFGLIAGGQWGAILITGLLIPALVAWAGTANLLLLAAASVAGALGLLLYMTRAFAGQLAAPPVVADRQDQSTLADLLKHRYVVLIFVLVTLAWVGFFFLDNIFYDRAAARFPDEARLASFLGNFLAVLGGVTLLSTSFLSGAVITRYGERVGLLVLPVTLLVGTSAMVLTGSLAGGLALLFWLTMLTKLLNMALGFSIDRAAFVILYQPLPAEQRSRAQTTAEGMVQPLASGLAGVALLSLNTLLAGDVLRLMGALVLVLIAWLIVALRLGREYPRMLMQALARRRLGGNAVLVADGSSLAVLRQGLQSPHPGAVIYALGMLEAIEPDSLRACLPALLAHPAPEVRQEALRRIERLGLTEALGVVSQRLEGETSPPVRGAALRALATLGDAQALEQVYSHVEDADPQVRRDALAGLLRSGEIEGTLVASEKLIALLNSPWPAERIFAAQVLGEAGGRAFYRPLLKLLRDDDWQVRRAALVAAGKLKNPRAWPAVVAGLASPKTRPAAVAALVAGGSPVLPEIKLAFAQAGQDREMLMRLARICGRVGGDEAIALLKERWDYPDEEIRTHLVAGLAQCGYQAAGQDERMAIQQRIQAEMAEAAWILAALADLGDDATLALVREALCAMLARARARLWSLLSFRYDAQMILRARDNLGHPSAEKRAYALEVIDVLLAQELKGTLLPLLHEASHDQQLRALAGAFPQFRLSRTQRLVEMLAGLGRRLNPWTRACAVYTLGTWDDAEQCEAVVAAMAAPEPLIRETALWTLAKLDRAGYQRHLRTLRHDPNPQVAQAVHRLEAAGNGDPVMLSTIEKVLALKTVDIFAGTPDEILADVATLLEEVERKAGEIIFEKGELGECMYMIVAGRVRVHDAERTLNYLESGDVFGEMALLDPEPRMASVTAVEDTHLLRLDQEPFYELMDDRIEVVRGIIRVLTGHLRARVQDLNQARARLELLERSPAAHPG